MRWGKQHMVLFGIVGLAVALRLIHLWQISDELFFSAPIIDARLNVQTALALVNDSWAGPPEPYWKPPLYDYLLAVQLHASGNNVWIPRIVQIVFDAASCVLVFGIAVELFSRRVAYASAAATALCGPMIYFSGELLSASLAVVLDLVFVYLAVKLLRGALSPLRALGCGAVLGLAALVRPEILLLAPGMAVLLMYRYRGESLSRRGAAVAALACGVILLVAPVTLRNAIRGGDAVAISANGGINFYIGTEAGFRGMVGLRPGTQWERLVREPENEGIDKVGSAHSGYFVRKSAKVIADDPSGYAGRALKKVVLFWHGHELTSNEDLYQARGDSVVLRLLVWHVLWLYFPFGVLAPLALFGMGLAFRRRHPSRVLIGFVGTFVVVAMMFFVTSRFRLPALPVLAMFAAYAVEWAIEQRHKQARRILIAAAGGVLALSVVINSASVFAGDRAAYQQEITAEQHHHRGTALFKPHRRYNDAVRELRAAIALNPNRAATHYTLGLSYARLGQHAKVVAAMRAVVELGEKEVGERYFVGTALRLMFDSARSAPTLRATAFGRAATCFSTRDLDCAIAGFNKAQDSLFAGFAYAARGEQRLRGGFDERAIADLRQAAKRRPRDAYTRLLLGVALRRGGDQEAASHEFHEFSRLEWPKGELGRTLSRAAPGQGSFERELLDAALIAGKFAR